MCEIIFIFGNQREAHKFKNSISGCVSPMTMNDEDDWNFRATNLYLHKMCFVTNLVLQKSTSSYRHQTTDRPTNQPCSQSRYTQNQANERYDGVLLNNNFYHYIAHSRVSILNTLHIFYMRAHRSRSSAKGLEWMRIEQMNSLTISWAHAAESRTRRKKNENRQLMDPIPMQNSPWNMENVADRDAWWGEVTGRHSLNAINIDARHIYKNLFPNKLMDVDFN